MEPLLKQLRELPARLAALPAKSRALLIGGVALVVLVGVGAAVLGGHGDNFQYVFTNLTPEDSTEAAAALKTAGIAMRLDAGGAALAVPADKVYEARLLLATAGLPRGGGVGFELFDKGDLGVSEFTQRVNLRRATEGELARTIGRLAEVRSARVHVTLAERGLFRDEERKPSAAVVVNLQPGRALGERELAGIKHLVASAVPTLASEAVTIVDGHGTVLSSTPTPGEASAEYAHRMERDLEARIVSLLEPVVGSGAILARVDAALDTAEVGVESEAYDPESAALRSERRVSQSQNQSAEGAPRPGGFVGGPAGGVAGAAGNSPPSAPAPTGPSSRGASATEEESRNYEINKTVTKTVNKTPRLQRLSVAVLLDGVEGKPRADADVARLGELAKRAVGFDAARGDQFEISSAVFTRANEEAPAAAPAPSVVARYGVPVGGAALGVIALALIIMALRPRRGAHPVALEAQLLRPGASIAQIEAAQALTAAAAVPGLPAAGATSANDGAVQLRDRARNLALNDPARAAQLLRAWIVADRQTPEDVHG